MFEKMYIEGDRRFKKSRFILLFVFNIAAVCVVSIAAYSDEFDTMAAAFLIQFMIFMISVFYVKKYEADIAGEENYAKTKNALVFIVAKIVALILGCVIVAVITRITEGADASVLIAIPDIIGYIAVAAVLGFRTCLHKHMHTSFRQILMHTALKILAVRQHACGFLPCLQQNYARKSAYISYEDRF